MLFRYLECPKGFPITLIINPKTFQPSRSFWIPRLEVFELAISSRILMWLLYPYLGEELSCDRTPL